MKHLFSEWCKVRKPDYVTKMVVRNLLFHEDRTLIFEKMIRFEKSGSFGLCKIFHDLFVFVGINDKYFQYRTSKAQNV